MKNREEPSNDSTRGGWSARQTDSVSRPGRTVSASFEQPAVSRHPAASGSFPEMLMEAVGLGVWRRQAIRHGKIRKGYWHMAKTIASGVGMTNKWLQEQGLVSLKSLWASLAPPVDRNNAG